MFSRRNALRLMAGGAAAVGLMGVAPIPKANPLSKEGSLNLFGKLPASSPKVMFRDYITPDKLPPLPSGDFGHYPLVSNWGMLGNGPGADNPPYAPDGLGVCAEAGPFHSLQLWDKMADVDINVDATAVIAAYSAITGYVPGDANTDNGSNVQSVAEYWRTTGLTDSDGRIHKIDAYVALEPGNAEQLFHAIHLFNGVGIGVNFPREWMNAFNAGIPWDAVARPHIAGGHYITGVGARSGMIQTVSWGKVQPLTIAGYEQFSDEAWAFLDEDKLVNDRDIDGFNLQQLKDDLAQLAKV